MGPATKATADRLVAAIAEYNQDGKHAKLAARAASGEFADFGYMHTCPITELHRLCKKYGLNELAARVANGEFAASKEESDEWANGPDVAVTTDHLAFTKVSFRELQGTEFRVGQHHRVMAKTLDRVLTGELNRLIIFVRGDELVRIDNRQK